MSFWILSCLMALVVLFPLLRAMARGGPGGRSAADFDIAVYREQLAELERDLERGVIAPGTAERTRLEISRRILDADRERATRRPGAAPRWATRAAMAAGAAVLLGGSIATYDWLGAPGYGDLPLQHRMEMAARMRAERPSQAAAEAERPPAPPPQADPQYLELVAQLRRTVAERDSDPRGFQLLAQNEANLGNFTAAYEAQRRLLELTGAEAPASGWSELAELYVMAAGGYVSPEAETALDEALARDPRDPLARYYMALMHDQTGRPDIAFGLWRDLLEQSRPDAPWVAPIRAQIGQAAQRAGIRYTPPAAPAAPALPGPEAADIAAAQDLSDGDRQAMVEGMVEGLAARLADQGGSAAEWARLIGALGVLGQTGRAQAIYDEARGSFAADPAAMAQLDAAARQAGLNL
ncbi:c-type cytochrome biogenesis protein CcmI [Mangrovicoccus algicola]|uniref:C-type cytochrome biogenesis protein CcmI n=1 Tax=Mangrovicoccus algicola TaxID=2771008 RepID=A0A8J6YU98_9RHOB|nr:c-type cytochrome biogenesis protein CcmI [Mangrovicoccus algicola]MBE3637702.1 c-type cytochrome biogenesis protein CcmI [Mangrovicoccus algicola]